MEGNSNCLQRKLKELLTDFEGDNDMSPAELCIKEEMVEEIMQELHKEMISPSACTKIPTAWPASFPSPSSSLSSLSTTSLFSLARFTDSTEGKSDSCGASLSDSASTVMAGTEYVGSAVKMGSPENAVMGIVVEGGEGCNYEVGVGETVDDCDGEELDDDDDDEWLGRLLSWDPPQVDDHCR